MFNSTVIWLALSVGLAAPPSTTIYRMEGAAPGLGREAGTAAVNNAETNIIISILESMTGSSDFALYAPILDRAPEYIRSVHVLSRTPDADQTQVEIEAYVYEEQLRRDVSALILTRLNVKPSVLLVLLEEPAPGQPYIGIRENPILEGVKKTLEDKFFTVMGPMWELYDEQSLVSRLRGTPEEAARVGLEHKAGVILEGEITRISTQEAPSSNISRNEIALKLRVILSETGTLLDTIEIRRAVSSTEPEEGYKQAATDAGESVKDRVLTSTTIAAAGAKPSSDVYIDIEQLGESARMEAVTKVLNGIEAVQGVDVLLSAASLGRLRIKYEGPMAPLVDFLVNQNYAGFHLERRRVVQREAILRVQ